MASVPYIFGTRSDQWTLSGLEVDADFQAIYDSLIDPTESPFGVEGRRIVIIDGTLSAPLTGMSYLTPSVYLERWDGSTLPGGGGADGVSIAHLIEMSALGVSDAAGGFVGLQSRTRLLNDGASSGNQNTGVGIQGVGQITTGIQDAVCIGMVSLAYLDAGAGTSAVSAYGHEINIANNVRDATATVGDGTGTYACGMVVRNIGSFKSTVAIWIPVSSTTFETGIYVQNIEPGGSGLVLDGSAVAIAPWLEFRTTGADDLKIGQSANSMQMLGNGGASIFEVALATGALQIVDTTKAFASLQTVSYGANDSGGVGFKLLRIPN